MLQLSPVKFSLAPLLRTAPGNCFWNSFLQNCFIKRILWHRCFSAIFKARIRRMWTRIRRIRADSADLADSTESADSTDSTDLADSADSTDSADLADLTDFSVSFTLLLKVLYLLASYPLSYTWLKVNHK